MRPVVVDDPPRIAEVDVVDAGLPERRLKAVVEAVVHAEKLTDVLPAVVKDAIDAVAQGVADDAVVGVQCVGEGSRLRANERDGRRFERFDETARIADRHDVADPDAPMGTAAEPHDTGVLRLRVLASELGFGGLVTDECRTVHISPHDPLRMLDAPAPSGVHGLAGRVRQHRLARRAHPATNHRTVAVEGLGKGHELLAKGLAQQQGSEPGAIDKEVRLKPPAVFELQRTDPRGGSLDAGDGAFEDPDAAAPRELFEIPDEQFVFDVIAEVVIEHRRPVGLPPEGLARMHQRGMDASIGEVIKRIVAVGTRQAVHTGVDLIVKCVDKFRTLSPQEPRAKFPGRTRLGMKFRGVDAEIAVKVLGHVGEGPLAHPDDPEVGRT